MLKGRLEQLKMEFHRQEQLLPLDQLEEGKEYILLVGAELCSEEMDELDVGQLEVTEFKGTMKFRGDPEVDPNEDHFKFESVFTAAALGRNTHGRKWWVFPLEAGALVGGEQWVKDYYGDGEDADFEEDELTCS